MKSFEPEDILQFNSVGFPSVSPNGETLAFLRHRPNPEQDTIDTELQVIGLEVEDSSPLSVSRVARKQPIWSQDSRGVYFLDASSRSIRVVSPSGEKREVFV